MNIHELTLIKVYANFIALKNIFNEKEIHSLHLLFYIYRIIF